MATLYDMNYLRQIEANDSEFNKAQKADNLRNMQANIAINGLPEQQNAMQQPVISQPTPAPVEAAMPQTAQESDPSWYLKANTLPTKVTQAAAQGSTPSFSAQAVTNAAIANLMKKGYSQDEAAQMLSPYIMDWQYRERQENKAKADNIMQQMSNMQYGSQDYYNAALQMYQVDPERGQMLLRGAVTPKDMWVRQNHLDDIEDQRNWQIQAAGMGLLGGGGRRGRGGGSGGGGGRSVGGGGRGRRGRPAAEYGGITTSQYNMMTKVQERLAKQIATLRDAGKDVPDSLRQRAMAIDNLIERYENNVAGLSGGFGDNSPGEAIAPGMTKEQLANGVQNVLWDDGLKYNGPSEDALNYLIEKTGASAGLLGNVSKALYNKAAKENQADAADFENDASLSARQQLFGEGMNEASRRGYKVDLDGTIYGASKEFINKYPDLKYAPGADYYKGLLAQSFDYDEEDENT